MRTVCGLDSCRGRAALGKSISDPVTDRFKALSIHGSRMKAQSCVAVAGGASRVEHRFCFLNIPHDPKTHPVGVVVPVGSAIFKDDRGNAAAASAE